MIAGRDNLIKWFKSNDARFWKLKNETNSYLISESPRDEKVTVDVSLFRLNEILDQVGAGRFFIECKRTLEQTKDLYKTFFEISDNSQSTGSGIVHSPDAVQIVVNKAIEEFKKDLLIEELKRQVKDGNFGETSTDRIVKRLEPYLDEIMSEIFEVKIKKDSKLSGTTEDKEEYQERIEKAIEVLAKHDEDLDLTLEKLAKLATNDPEKYKLAKSMVG